MLDARSETRVEILQQACGLLQDEVGRLVTRLRDLTLRNAHLEGRVLTQAELDILETPGSKAFQAAAEPITPEAKPKAAKKPQKGHGPRPQPRLPRQEQLYELPQDEQTCQVCQGELEEMGLTEDSEEITLVERTYSLVLHRRKKYRCRCNANVVTAHGPAKLIPGGRYSADFGVSVAVDKYVDQSVPRRHAHLPQGRRSTPCCMEDEGRPLGIGVQAQVSNHLELRGSRAQVVSVEGKGAARPRQVRSRKTSESEPLMTCREVFTRRQNRAVWLARDEPRGSLFIGWAASGMKAA